MSSQISVQYHTDSDIINDSSTWLIPHVGDFINFNGKEYRVTKIKNTAYMNSNHWVNKWNVHVYLEPFDSDNIN